MSIKIKDFKNEANESNKSSPAAKYIRKTSEIQKELMIEYFETHDGAIEIVSANATDAELKRGIWSDIADLLNKVEGGTKKNDMKWAKTWADMKLYTKNRARAAKKGVALPNARKPSDLDKRVLRVTGHEDLLQDWEASLMEPDIAIATTYEKITGDETSENEIVVTEGTDYEFIEEEDMDGNNQDIVRIQSEYFEHGYDYTPESMQVFKVQTKYPSKEKRKRTSEPTDIREVIEMGIDESDENDSKRLKTEEEENTQGDATQDPMVGAINNLATALQSVASALLSFADVAKTFNRR